MLCPWGTRREQSGSIASGSNLQLVLETFAGFVQEVLPFLYAQKDAPNGTKCPAQKRSTAAICCLLGVSRNFLYLRKSKSLSNVPTGEELHSIIDTAVIQTKQHRRRRDRTGYLSISELSFFECRCFQPCLGNQKVSWLKMAQNTCSRALNPLQKDIGTYWMSFLSFDTSPDSIYNKAL